MHEIAPPIPINTKLDSLFVELDGLTYWERRQYFRKRISNQYPRYFYKFFPFDPEKKESVRNLRSVLTESNFWLANHESFNDPFDLKANILFTGSNIEKKSKLKALIGNQSSHLPRKERVALLEKMMSRPNEEWDSDIKRIYKKHSKAIGICSFATDAKPLIGQNGNILKTSTRLGPRSILMWAHYARNHCGVCLQFETIHDHRIFTAAMNVEYSDDYPHINYIDSNFEDSIFRPLIQKHKGWEYENEWRILHMTGAEKLLPFKPSALKRVIFGCRASAQIYAGVEELLAAREKNGFPPVELYRATQHPAEYKLMLWRIKTRK